MTLKNTFLMFLAASAIGFIIATVWNVREKLAVQKAHVTIGEVEILKTSEKERSPSPMVYYLRAISKSN